MLLESELQSRDHSILTEGSFPAGQHGGLFSKEAALKKTECFAFFQSKILLFSSFFFFFPCCWRQLFRSKKMRFWLKSSRLWVLAPVQRSASCDSSLHPSYIYKYCPNVMFKAFTWKIWANIRIWMLFRIWVFNNISQMFSSLFLGGVCRWSVGGEALPIILCFSNAYRHSCSSSTFVYPDADDSKCSENEPFFNKIVEIISAELGVSFHEWFLSQEVS